MKSEKIFPILAACVLSAALLVTACSSLEHNITQVKSPKDPVDSGDNSGLVSPIQEAGSPPDDSQADADVVFVRAVLAADSTWTFHVSVTHPDTGWQDYADGWDVLLPDGTVLKVDPQDPFTRLLLHPHENEQPFTRSQSRIVIPEGVDQVRVRAHDLVDGFGGQEIIVELNQPFGEHYKVEL